MKLKNSIRTTVQANGIKPVQKKNIVVFSVPFLITLSVYTFTLAPTVTFEDSGELIAAAYHLGVPHQPGYPLFTLIGRLFCLLPFEPVAFRMNFMSAWFGALASGMIALSLWLLLKMKYSEFNKHFKMISDHWMMSISVISGMVFSFAYETWEQSIITEVYSLHHFLIAIMIFQLILWKQSVNRKDVWFVLLCYTGGLALTNHHLSIVVFPAFIFMIWFSDRAFFFNIKRIVVGFIVFIIGLTVYMYLPVSSNRDPVMDWGNPENWMNFWNTIYRQQYQLTEPHTWARWAAQMSHYGQLLLTQWPVFIMFFILTGFYTLFRIGREWLFWGILYLIGTIVLTVYGTNFDIRDPNPVIADENKHLVSVFYTGSYLFMSMLTGLGIFQVLLWLKNKTARMTAGGLILVISFWIVASNMRLVSMRDYRFAEHYAHNLFSTVKNGSLILTNYDPHYFTVFYYQYVENMRQDVTVVDVKLLQTSWYMDWLQRTHPELMRAVQNEYQPYRTMIDQYERGMLINNVDTHRMYAAFVNAMIKTLIRDHRRVYLTFDPPENMAAEYYQISTGAAIELLQQPSDIEPVVMDQIVMDDYFDEGIPKDRMARFFMTYYGRLFMARAVIDESLQKHEDALKGYEISLSLLKSDRQFAPVIKDAIKRIKSGKHSK